MNIGGQVYSLYIPKYAKDKSLFLVTRIVHLLAKHHIDLNHPFGILMAPGYLSCSYKTIREFTERFPLDFPVGNSEVYIGIFKGMNSNNGTMGYKSGLTIHKVHSGFYKQKNYRFITLCWKNDITDHRKMLFFFTLKNSPIIPYIQRSDISKFINNIDVDYVLIGSSNQSMNTYFGNNKGIADKGEADLLLFNDRSFLNVLADNSKNPESDHYIPINISTNHTHVEGLENSSCILSSSHNIVSPSGYQFGEPDSNYLNNILTEYMYNCLSDDI